MKPSNSDLDFEFIKSLTKVYSLNNIALVPAKVNNGEYKIIDSINLDRLVNEVSNITKIKINHFVLTNNQSFYPSVCNACNFIQKIYNYHVAIKKETESKYKIKPYYVQLTDICSELQKLLFELLDYRDDAKEIIKKITLSTFTDRITKLAIAFDGSISKAKKELELLLGVKQQTISDYFLAKNLPNADKLKLIANHYNTTIDYLLNPAVNEVSVKVIEMSKYTGLSISTIIGLNSISKNCKDSLKPETHRRMTSVIDYLVGTYHIHPYINIFDAIYNYLTYNEHSKAFLLEEKHLNLLLTQITESYNDSNSLPDSSKVQELLAAYNCDYFGNISLNEKLSNALLESIEDLRSKLNINIHYEYSHYSIDKMGNIIPFDDVEELETPLAISSPSGFALSSSE